jgi:acetate kinase
MKILVLNCGSSSIKFQLFEMKDKTVPVKGVAEKVGLKGSFVRIEKLNGEKVRFEGEIIDHLVGIEYILGIITSKKHGCINQLSEIDAVGHRVVNGGERFSTSVRITDEVQSEVERFCEIAPLHNPANLKGINAIKMLIPGIPQVAVFDTAFHQTLPPYAYMYAIPYSLYKKYGIRKYGFHGTSHYYVSKRACEILKVDITRQRIITIHLGNGASMAAVKDGKSIDTSMGFTPLEGLIMGTRPGDIDAGVLPFIMDKEEIGLSAIGTLVNKQCGMLGITGVSSDMREIEEAADTQHNSRAVLGLDMYNYRVKKYIGAFAAVMGGVEIIVFAGGIGENSPESREHICEGLEFLGMEFDKEKNKGIRSKEAVISTPGSRVKVMVVPTDEELVIAEDTMRIISENKKNPVKNDVEIP